MVVAACAVAVGLIVHDAGRSASDGRGGEPTAVSTPSMSRQRLPTRAASPTPTPSPVRQWQIRGFLDDTDLDLFARSDTHLYRIQTATQTVTATDTPGLQSSGALMVIVDEHQVLVRGWGTPGDGFRVVDGKPPVELPEALKTPDLVLPGPPGRLWVTTYRGDDPSTRLTDLNGRPVQAARGPSAYRADSFQSDGRRGLILSAAGGYYDMTDDGPRRLTRGQLVAVGQTVVLTAECDAELRCARYLVNRDTGQRRRIGAAPVNLNAYGNGTISDNGRYAALWHWSRTEPLELSIQDLHNGTTMTRAASSNGGNDASSLVWLPDGRLVTILDQHLVIYDPANGKITRPDLGLDDLQQLTLRTPR